MAGLLDAPDAEAARERAPVATDGCGARLLAEQDPAGSGRGRCTAEVGLDHLYPAAARPRPADRRTAAQAGVAALLDGARRVDGGLTLTKTVPEPETCITAMLVGRAATFGMVDQRVLRCWRWLLDQQLADGGFNSETIRSGNRQAPLIRPSSSSRRCGRGPTTRHRGR